MKKSKLKGISYNSIPKILIEEEKQLKKLLEKPKKSKNEKI